MRDVRIVGAVFALFLLQPVLLGAEVHSQSVLEPFFYNLLSESEAGYVFFGEKPICSEGYSTELILLPTCREHKKQIAFWKGGDQIHQQEGNIQILSKGSDLLIVNKQKLIEVVQDSLPLFQYVLGPLVSAERIFDLIVEAEDWQKALQYDKSLIGIVLGYGVQNSLLVSRLEELEEALLSEETPPNKAHVASFPSLQRNFQHFVLETPFHTAVYQTNGKRKSNLFDLTENEFQMLQRQLSFPPKELLQNKPIFLFGLNHLDPTNSQKIDRLLKMQKQIQRILQDPAFLERVFSFLSWEIPLQEALESEEQKIISSNQAMERVARVIIEYLRKVNYDSSQLASFFSGWDNLEISENKEDLASLVPIAKKRFFQIRENIRNSNEWFRSLGENPEYQTKEQNSILFKTREEGLGAILNQRHTRAWMEWTCYDPVGNVASSSNGVEEVLLTNTIRGFALGVQGMKEGEQREIWVHPSSGYGIASVREPCIPLQFIVRLEKVGNEEELGLEVEEPFDIDFVFDVDIEKRYEFLWDEEAKRAGAYFRQSVSEIPGLDETQILSRMKQLTETFCLSLSDSEKEELLNFYQMTARKTSSFR